MGTSRFYVETCLLFQRCVYQEGREVNQLMVPKRLRTRVLTTAHDAVLAGHRGVKSTTTRILKDFFWPGLQSDVKQFVRSCDIRQRTTPKR